MPAFCLLFPYFHDLECGYEEVNMRRESVRNKVEGARVPCSSESRLQLELLHVGEVNMNGI
jgi:hypothetical protein